MTSNGWSERSLRDDRERRGDCRYLRRSLSDDGRPIGEKTINVGGKLRYFGDGWQISKRLCGKRYWRIPVMDGEFTCEEIFGTVKGVAGGNIILLGTEPAATLSVTELAV